jgi:cytoskeletal protein RodZ
VSTDRLSSDTPTSGYVKAAPKAAAPAANASASAPPPNMVLRWISWGPGSSAALSIVCFVVILGAVIGFQHIGQKRTAQEDTPQQTTAQTVRDDPATVTRNGGGNDASASSAPAVAMPVATQSATMPTTTVDASLSRARTCAAASHWNCVLDSASGVLAVQEGNAEAQSLLQQAIVHGGWATETSSIAHETANTSGGAAAPVSRSHTRRHWHTAARRSKPSEDDE